MTIVFTFSEAVVVRGGLSKLVVFGTRSPPSPVVTDFRPGSLEWSVTVTGRSRETLTVFLDEGALSLSFFLSFCLSFSFSLCLSLSPPSAP